MLDAVLSSGSSRFETKAERRTIRENMTLKEQREFLNRFAKAAGVGLLLNVQELKVAYEKAIGDPTSNSTIYNLLARHDWRK